MSFSTILINTYRRDVNLYINTLTDDFIKQVWYADDATACQIFEVGGTNLLSLALPTVTILTHLNLPDSEACSL